MNSIKFLALVLFLPFGTQAQTEIESKQQINGVILDYESKRPISNTEIFIVGTSIGTISGTDGRFTLQSNYFPCQIVIMHLSYKPLIIPVSSEKEIRIELHQHEHAINEVNISAKNMRKRNLRLFYRYFLWNASSQEIKVVNDSVLQFDRSETDLHTTCESPLLVVNKQLGYEIKLLLNDFHICKKRGNGEKVKLNSATGTAVFKLKGAYYYKEISPDSPYEEEKVKRKRKIQYYGSLRHFLTSLYTQELKSNGFTTVSAIDTSQNTLKLALEHNGLKQYQFMTDKVSVTYFRNELSEPINIDSVFTTYRYEKSTLISLGKNFDVRSNGTSPELSFELIGAMGQESPINSLPENYKP